MLKSKTMGIVGGMGPYATLKFFEYILASDVAKCDSDHLRLLIDNNVHIPNRIKAVKGDGPSPVKAIVNSINNLASIGAQAIAIPCNSVHYFYNNTQSLIKIPWLNMIELVSEKLMLHHSKPLILGAYITNEKKLYNKFIKNAEYLNESHRQLLYEIIDTIKLGKKVPNQFIQNLISHIKTLTNCNAILLACTELSFIKKRGCVYLY